MTLRGSAFLALWNDVDPDRRAEYEDWHAVEHVPERVGVEGFRAGRRYVAFPGQSSAGPRYFTLYELESLAALSGPAYAEVVENPTPWSRSMRPSLRNVIRRACTMAVSIGVGAAKAMATVEFVYARQPASDTVRAAAAGALERVAEADGIVGVHLGIEDRSAANTHPLHATWRTPTEDGAPDGRLVLLIESVDVREATRATDPAADALREALGGEVRVFAPTVYEAATWIERSHLPRSPGRRPALLDRWRRWSVGGCGVP